MSTGTQLRLHTALEGDSQVDCNQHCREANESLTSQFNNGGSTGRSKCGRTQVGSEEDAKKLYKMEMEKQIGEEEREATKEKGTRFATHAGVPVQGLEANTGCLVAARGEQIDGFYSKKLDKDPEDTTPRTSSDQDEEYGVQTRTTGPQEQETKTRMHRLQFI